MKLALISPHTHPIALGIRYLSAVLKRDGHDVAVFFMCSRRSSTRPDWSTSAVEQLLEALRDRDLIGLSLMTNNFHRARFITERIRSAGIRAPIVWGGTHPTVAPEESLGIADAICIGEGENPLSELIRRLESGRDPTGVPGLAFRAGGAFGNDRPICNPIPPLEQDLDRLPLPDWDIAAHWIATADGLVRPRPEHMRSALDTYRMQTSRGCPFHCTFCNNTALQQLYKGTGRWTRMRSIENILTEIRLAVRSFPSIRSISFIDDLFLVRREEELEEFARRYNAEFSLPLQLDAFPNTVTERKVAVLARLPIELVSMGIESASQDTLDNIYLRPTPKKRIAEAIEAFARHGVRTEYHYIVNNPYEPERNVVETMRFIADHHRGPSVLRVLPLMFYPGTPLFQRARADGLLGERDQDAYDHMGTGTLQTARYDYLAIWLHLVLHARNIGLPRWFAHRMIDFCTARPVRFCLDRRWFRPAFFVSYQLGRKIWRNLIHQPLIKPLRYLRSRRTRREPAARAIPAGC